MVHLSCDVCPLSFQSQQALALHKFKAHGVKNPIRQYVDGVHCPVRLKLFWSRERVINHLRYRSKVCLWVDESNLLDEQEHGANVQLSRRGQRSHCANIPAVQMLGPLLHVFALPGTESATHPLCRGHNRW